MSGTNCTCERCTECGGTGYIWLSFTGEYLGDRRCDDMDTMEPCEECGGSGITETCDVCAAIIEMEDEY